ncbi:thioredoxin domain-containing protein [Sulfurimonas paralvinellae]|uniref:Thioredoxin domain-containing protein n=1 Tax=Sulfurimonas paralvinellae TaxID=317658 RepID=A0A7M1B6W5_9BACT|nr:DUF255 domain-containing protein [Sulfurimonas paralvinellae]QOP45477.1 thioredoxin domain-containing protein [Sulfurimonas paralvinellae]
MKILFVMLFLVVSLLQAKVFTNALAKETSPYLLQHADNPVVWMPLGKEAFLKANKENKPLYISIGYSTCHWCHVMEEESFTNIQIAALLNKYFICIKVDREELPQTDALYQNIYKKYSGHAGGWPLNVFMTPQKDVFYITTYIPPKQRPYAEGFDTLLPKLHRLYLNKKHLQKAVENIAHATQKREKSIMKKDITLNAFVNSFKKMYDSDYPGFGHSKQFPQASKIALTLDLAELTQDAKLKEAYLTLLDTMAMRGLYDHIEGGFFRYSVDVEWEIPHFEKMLYTQAELLPLYVRGYEISHKPLYKDIVTESIAMLDKRFVWNNLYFSASDADSDAEEGGYYTFSRSEIDKALKYNVHEDDIKEALGFRLEGNMHVKIHLGFDNDERPKGFREFQTMLREVRKSKKFPFIDKKINTAWNAMMIEALYKADYIDVKYAKKANRHLQALQNLMLREQELYHQSVPDHIPSQKGLLEDYAFFIGALIASYESSYDEDKLMLAEYLLWQAKEKFYKNGVWYLSEQRNVKADLNDKYYTSSLSKIIQDILKLSGIKESLRYEKLAYASMNNLHLELQERLADAPALARAYLMQKEGVVSLKSKKENLLKNYKKIQEILYPYIVTVPKDYDSYLACTLRQCFSQEKELKLIIEKINRYKKKI